MHEAIKSIWTAAVAAANTAVDGGAAARDVGATGHGHVMFMSTLVALGVLVLFSWVVVRTGRREPLSLGRSPGRPNSMGLPHLLVIMGYGLLDIVLSLGSGGVEDKSLKVVDLEGMLSYMLVVLVISLVVASRCFTQGIGRGLGLSPRRWFVDCFRGLLSFLAVFPVCQGLMALSYLVVPESLRHSHDLVVFLQARPGSGGLVMAYLVAVVGAPLSEEVLYRGLLQTAMKKVTGGPWTAILASSAFFAFIHLKVAPGPLRLVGLEALAPLMALAVVLGYNYERTGRLWPSIVVHMLYNAVVLSSVLMSQGD